MRTITLPVIAHRIFGIGREPRTAWSADLTLSEGPLAARVTSPFSKSWNSPILWSAARVDWRDRGVEEEFGAGLTSTFIKPAPGTRRTIDEIRDLFDGAGRAETTSEHNLTQIWEPAGIAFRLVSVVDHAVRTDRAMAIPADEVGNLALRLNHTSVLNMYFFRSINNALGVGYFSAFPDDPAKNAGYVAVEDMEEWCHWSNFVETVAHEIGHFLTLPHEEESENLMSVVLSSGHFQLRPIQIVLARSCALRYEAFSRRLCAINASFREIYEDPEAPPSQARAYRGESWRFG